MVGKAVVGKKKSMAQGQRLEDWNMSQKLQIIELHGIWMSSRRGWWRKSERKLK